MAQPAGVPSQPRATNGGATPVRPPARHPRAPAAGRPNLPRRPRGGAECESHGRPPAALRARGGGPRQPRRREAWCGPPTPRVRRDTPMPRASSRPTTAGSRPASSRPSRRSVAMTSSSRSSRHVGARSAIGFAGAWRSGYPRTPASSDRVRMLAVLQDEAGYLAEAHRRRRRHDPAARAQLRDRQDLPSDDRRMQRGARPVPGAPGSRRRARDAHRIG